MLFIDHYAIQDNTNQEPTILTVWFGSTGRQGLSLTLITLIIDDYTNQHAFQVNGVTVPANSVVPVTIDTAGSGFNFTSGHCYSLGLVTDESIFRFGNPICHA